MKPDLPEPTFLSVPDSAKICGVSRNTVYMWVRQGKLGAYQTPGRTNLIRPSDLVRFMKDNGMFVPGSLTEMALADQKMEGVSENEGVAGSLSILVVDDDPMCRSLVVRALRDEATVHQAETGYEALHVLTVNPEIDIVLLDLRMPGQHGLETLRELKRLKPSVQVAVVSGYSNELPVDLIRNGTIVNVLEKPVTVQDLREAVYAMVEESVD